MGERFKTAPAEETPPVAKEAGDQADIEKAGLNLVDSFANNQKDTLRQIDPEAFDTKIDMVREEARRTGGALQRFQGKASRMIGMAMLGVSLSWGIPHGTEAGPAQRIEMRDDHYDVADRALQEAGIILPMDTALPKDMRYRAALRQVDNSLSQLVRSNSMELAIEMGKVERDNKKPGLLFELHTKGVEEYLIKADKINQAARLFVGEDGRFSSFPQAHLYDYAREQVEKARRMIAEAKNPSEVQQQIWKVQERIDMLEKEWEKRPGLPEREWTELEGLRGKLKQLKEKPQDVPSSEAIERQPKGPSLVEQRKSDETPAEIIKREGESLRRSQERIEELQRRLQEEMKRILPQEKK